MYIHLNPVRADMVDDPSKYKWSSFQDYTRLKSRFDWLMRDEILANYGRDKSRHRRYRRECLALAGVSPAFLEQLRSGMFLGTRDVLDDLARKYKPAGKAESVPGFGRFGAFKKRGHDIKREIRRVARTFGVRIEDLSRKRKDFTVKLAAYYHLVENCGISVVDTASEFSVSVSAVSHGIKRFKKMMLRDKKIRSLVKQLSQ
jgi:hypothetical protein